MPGDHLDKCNLNLWYFSKYQNIFGSNLAVIWQKKWGKNSRLMPILISTLEFLQHLKWRHDLTAIKKCREKNSNSYQTNADPNKHGELLLDAVAHVQYSFSVLVAGVGGIGEVLRRLNQGLQGTVKALLRTRTDQGHTRRLNHLLKMQ